MQEGKSKRMQTCQKGKNTRMQECQHFKHNSGNKFERQHRHNFEFEKLAPKTRAKNAQIHAKMW